MINQSIWGDWDAAFARADYVPVTAPICATANMMHIAQILVLLAPLAGFGEDVPGYEALLASSVTPFNDYYALNLGNGTYVDGIEQTPALMALVIGFVPDAHIAATKNWLIHGACAQPACHQHSDPLRGLFSQTLKRREACTYLRVRLEPATSLSSSPRWDARI